MKKFIVAVLIIVGFVFYSFLYSNSNAAPVLPNITTSSGTSSRSSTNAVSSTPGATDTTGTSNTSNTPTTTSSSGSGYKDGSYTGSVADAQWGYIQVKAIIQGGKITDVQFLQYPDGHNRSIMINNYADPQLTSEAIQAQSANVDIITGATDSSEAFIQSLTDALSQAKA
jgi:uncharacterized protein with FMN-binding domain